MRQVMAQDVVTDQMPCIPQRSLQVIKRCRNTDVLAANYITLSTMDCSEIEYARGPRINLDVK